MGTALPFDMLIFVLAVFVGALVAGIAGFAFGLIASPIWLHVITPAQSAVLIAAYAILIQGATLWKLRHTVQPSRLLPYIAGGAIGIPIGRAILYWASPVQMRAAIGIGLVLFSIYSLVRPTLPAAKGGFLPDGIVGVVSGIFGGSTGLAGVPVIIWSSLRRFSKDEQRAIFQPVAIANLLLVLLWFGSTGGIDGQSVRFFFAGLPAVAIGTWLGFRLYGKLDEPMFRRIVLVLLLFSGLTLLPRAKWAS